MTDPAPRPFNRHDAKSVIVGAVCWLGSMVGIAMFSEYMNEKKETNRER